MLTTEVGEVAIPAPRMSNETALAQAEPIQLHLETDSGAEYYLDIETQTVLARQNADGLFTYSGLDRPDLPKLRVGQHYNPSNLYGLGSRIVAITSRQSHECQPPDDTEDSLSRMRETHVHARFLLDLAATKSQSHE